MKKIASAKLTKEMINGKYGAFEAYIIRGDTKEDTYSIKDQLKNMGFKWYKDSWWISSKKLSFMDKADLINRLGVISSEGQPANTPQANQPIPNNIPAAPAIQPPQAPQAPQTKQWQTENEEMTRWYGFPINHNIASWEEDFEVNGQPHHAFITIDRLYQKGISSGYHKETKSKEHRGLPKYRTTIRIPDLQVKDEQDYSDRTKKKDFQVSYNKLSDKKWGTYNEEELIEERKKLIKEVLSKPDSKINKQIQFEDNIAKRNPEYRQFLEDINDRKINPTYNFQIDDPLYGGDYIIGIDDLGMGERAFEATLEPVINDPTAPNVVLYHQKVDIYNTYSVDDFHNAVKGYLSTNKDKVQEDYIKYLKSFPYLQTQQEEAKGSFNSIIGYITGDNRDPDTALKILQNKGYIRPNKRQKQTPGLSMGDEIRWVIDSKKIVNDAYNTQNYASRMPEYFYSVLAYYIHRKVRGIWSWSDMALMDVMDVWYRRMKKMGATFSFDDVEKAIESIGNIIVNKIYGETKENRNKQFFNDFYGGFYGEQGGTEKSQSLSGLSDFSNFAKQYGVEVENITEENAKDIYRALAKSLHPDLQPDPTKKDEMTEKFKVLQNIWDKVPDQYKKANNWYERSIILS